MKRMTKRMIKGIMIIFFSVYLNAKENTEISKSTSGFSTSVSSVTIVDIDISTDVPVYEYVPKVIINGKWGSEPGEFGASDPLAEEQYGIPMRPSSLAVNSKGEIYILDCLNNRIQKFDSEGKYLKSIEVLCASDENGRSVIKVIKYPSGVTGFDINRPAVIRGVNIVIDSKDTLYYYLERRDYEIYEVSNRDERYSELTREHSYALWRDTYTVIYKLKGKRGEVWEYKEDKLVRKMKQGDEKIDRGYKNFDVRKGSNSETEILFEFEDNKIFKFKPSLAPKTKLHKKTPKYVQQPELTKDLVIIATYNEDSNPSKHGMVDRITYVYDKKEKLKWVVNGVIPGMIDNEGNGYVIDVTDNGVMVKKFEKVRVK